MTNNSYWEPAQYSAFATGSGAAKLADSAVAPLVAYARGIYTVTPEQVKALLGQHGFAGNSAQGLQIKSAVGSTDALYMPWYRPEDVVMMERGGYEMASPAPQLKPNPANVKFNDSGKAIKYVALKNNPTILGPHPAVPAAWLVATGRNLFFTEGMLKADSALTAMLLQSGVTTNELAVTDADTDVLAARSRLRDLLQSVPADQQTIIIGFFSVTTFEKNPEWNGISCRDVTCHVAFDGDVEVNPMVWAQADKLFELIKKKGGTPKLLDLSGATDSLGQKAGVDDFLAAHGNWADLMALAVDTLPKRPKHEAQYGVGDWRMDEAAKTTQVYSRSNDEDGTPSWKKEHEFTARVKTIEDKRSVTAEEIKTGKFRAARDGRNEDSRVEIEVAWESAGEERAAIVAGPHHLMATRPEDWRKLGADVVIPSAVSHLETWPPTKLEFTTAMKRYRRDDTKYRPLWNHTGWVPTEGSTPVFLVGTQCIGPDGEQGNASTSVTDGEVQNSEKFGVVIPIDDDEARHALRAMLDVYYPSDESLGVWRNPRHAATIVAAALRPVVPIQTRVPVVFTGASGSGKTYSAAAIMAFWQRIPGTWHERSLPGAASDTQASTEVAVSKTPIWVLDDLAPSEDEHGYNKTAQPVWNMVRAVHNGSFRARRTATMSAAEVHRPRALFICTAEQAPDAKQASILNRFINIKVASRMFLSASNEPTNNLTRMSAGDNEQALVTGYALQMVARRAADQAAGGWEAVVGEFAAEQAAHKAAAGQYVSGSDTNRQTSTAADITLGITVLEWMAAELGMAGELGPRLARMKRHCYEIAVDGYETQREATIGKQFLPVLRSLLNSHNFHISAVGLAGPPVDSAGTSEFCANAATVNDQLGWQPSPDGAPPRPGGTRIGTILTDSDGRLAVLFDPKAAFDAAKRTGSTGSADMTSVWSSLVEAKLHHAQWSPKSSGGGAGWKQRFTHNRMTYEGVVIPLWRLLDQDGPERLLDGNGQPVDETESADDAA